MFEFTVPIEPIGKARPRMSKFGGVYTPEKTKEAEEQIAKAYRVSGGKMMEGYLKLEVDAFFKIPKSATKKNRALMQENIIRPAKKPDADNILKLVADSLNDVAYNDDVALTTMISKKYYAEESRIVIRISADTNSENNLENIDI